MLPNSCSGNGELLLDHLHRHFHDEVVKVCLVHERAGLRTLFELYDGDHLPCSYM